MTEILDPVVVEDGDLGGKPNPGTPPDKRLKDNKKPKPAPSSEGSTEDLAATPPAEDEPAAPPVMTQTPQWQGILVQEGTETGDGREFAEDALTWGTPPLPLRWQKVDSHGGMPTNETVQVGTIQRVWRDGSNIMGEGVFDLGGPEDDDAHEAFRRNQAGSLTGISIDADDVTDADIEYIFPEADGEREEDDVFFLLFAQPEKMIFHAGRIRAATLCDIPAFIDAQIHPFTPEDPQAQVASILTQDQPPSLPGDEDRRALVAHAWHDEWRPPRAWFTDPLLGQLMPIMVTENGRVYGHAAPWGECHIGFTGECVMPPFESTHDHYMTGNVICDSGELVAVGQITAGLDHAPLYYSAAAAKDHYEDTSAVVADVVIGNDKHGIWVAGAVRPEADPARVRALRGSGQVSPDWREIGGRLRMVGLLTVNVSGYQVPYSRAQVASGRVRSLVAGGMIPIKPSHDVAEPAAPDLTTIALQHLRERLTRRVNGA